MNKDNSQIKETVTASNIIVPYFAIQLYWIVIFHVKCGSHHIDPNKVDKLLFKYGSLARTFSSDCKLFKYLTKYSRKNVKIINSKKEKKNTDNEFQRKSVCMNFNATMQFW